MQQLPEIIHLFLPADLHTVREFAAEVAPFVALFILKHVAKLLILRGNRTRLLSRDLAVSAVLRLSQLAFLLHVKLYNVAMFQYWRTFIFVINALSDVRVVCLVVSMLLSLVNTAVTKRREQTASTNSATILRDTKTRNSKLPCNVTSHDAGKDVTGTPIANVKPRLSVTFASPISTERLISVVEIEDNSFSDSENVRGNPSLTGEIPFERQICTSHNGRSGARTLLPKILILGALLAPKPSKLATHITVAVCVTFPVWRYLKDYVVKIRN